MKHVGFTGPRNGPTAAQSDLLRRLFSELEVDVAAGAGVKPTIVHHGDCIGTDAFVHDLALAHGLRVVVHPPTERQFRAYCEHPDELRDPLPYLVRDQVIVDESDLLVAVPGKAEEERRSGTWSTVRRAWLQQVPVLFLLPDGRTLKASSRSEFQAGLTD